MRPFPCTQCGKCCRYVSKSELTAYLDRGDGTCRHFDEDTKLCKIYQNRPLICRVEDMYKTHFAKDYTWEEFIAINLEICNKL